ncbi:MAG: hypothetical protein R3E95_18260 [Thiolinea sp.]
MKHIQIGPSAKPQPLIIGVGGGSGGGKTLLTQLLHQWLGDDQVTVLPLDAYYRNQVDTPLAVRGNFDHPESLDQELFFAQLRQLRMGVDIETLAMILPPIPGWRRPSDWNVVPWFWLMVCCCMRCKAYLSCWIARCMWIPHRMRAGAAAAT